MNLPYSEQAISLTKESVILLYQFLHGCNDNRQRKDRAEAVIKEARKSGLFNPKEAR